MYSVVCGVVLHPELAPVAICRGAGGRGLGSRGGRRIAWSCFQVVVVLPAKAASVNSAPSDRPAQKVKRWRLRDASPRRRMVLEVCREGPEAGLINPICCTWGGTPGRSDTYGLVPRVQIANIFARKHASTMSGGSVPATITSSEVLAMAGLHQNMMSLSSWPFSWAIRWLISASSASSCTCTASLARGPEPEHEPAFAFACDLAQY